jgi:sulfane dehydrogenase subunit SoxC
VRGLNSIYHNNCIQTWWEKKGGEVENVEVS